MKPVSHPDDCIKIQKLANYLGYDCSLSQAEKLWKEYSDKLCAGWLSIHEDDNYQIIDAIQDYFGE